MTERLSDLRSWQIFIELMQTESMSRAAVACGCDVSQVSRRIAALEKEVGYPLFERSTRASRPTSEAKELFERIYPVLSDIDRRLNAVTASVGLRKHRRQVRIQADVMSYMIIRNIIVRLRSIVIFTGLKVVPALKSITIRLPTMLVEKHFLM